MDEVLFAAEKALEDVVRLENTPEGQRESAIPVCADQPGFPYGWPQR